MRRRKKLIRKNKSDVKLRYIKTLSTYEIMKYNNQTQTSVLEILNVGSATDRDSVKRTYYQRHQPNVQYLRFDFMQLSKKTGMMNLDFLWLSKEHRYC